MRYRAIIREAWALTQENKKLMWWFAFVPSLLTFLVAMVYLTYQAYSLWHSPYFRPGASEQHLIADLFRRLVDLFYAQPSLVVFGLVILAILAGIYLTLPVFTQGALIQLVAHIRAGSALSITRGISYGFSRFLQLFEYHLFIKTFGLVSIFTEAAFAFRVFGPEPFKVFGWLFLLVAVVGLMLTLLFTYSEYYIVIDKQGVFSSIIKSSGLVVRQWHHTLFMVLLMSIIIIRIGLNILVALLVPALIVAPIFLFTSLALAKIGVLVGAVLGLVILYFSSYFLGVFHVFTTSVWTFTFLDLTHEESNTIDLHKTGPSSG